jgi:hypothetical protein
MQKQGNTMNIVAIDGLDARQKIIAAFLWNCETEQELVNLVTSLPTAEQKIEAASLVRILIAETQEQQGHLTQYEQSALEVIARARGR